VLITKLSESKRAQSRILEAVIAAAIIFIVFAASLFLISVSNVRVLQERADLDRLGYNTLHRLVESGTIESTIERRLQADLVRTITQKFLPPEIYFSLKIFICLDQGSWIKLEPHPSYPLISNTPEETFANSMETSSTSMIYTSKTGNIYQLVLVLAKAGGN